MKNFGFIAGPSSASREQREADLSTSEGTIAHSAEHGAVATMSEVARRTMAARDGKRSDVTIVGGRVVHVKELERAEVELARRTQRQRFARDEARKMLSAENQWYAWLEARWGEDGAAEIAAQLGEQRLRALMRTPKHKRRAELEELLKRKEHDDGEG